MTTLPSFALLLPETDDPAKEPIRRRLIEVLDSQGEILPSANSPRGKLWHLVNSPDSSLEECAEIIQLDSALASRILRVANSAAYGAPSENVTAAVLRLGLKFVREQVFSATVFKQYSGWVLPPEWDLFWLRNIFVARLCERMCSLHGPTSGAEYLAGLIHDMGWLFLATYCPDEYSQIFSGGRPLAQAEIDVMPVSHAEISASIAVRTLLPARAVEAIEFHHYPIALPDGSLTAAGENENLVAVALYVSDQLADLCHMDMFGPATLTTEALYEAVKSDGWKSTARNTISWSWPPRNWRSRSRSSRSTFPIGSLTRQERPSGTFGKIAQQFSAGLLSGVLPGPTPRLIVS